MAKHNIPTFSDAQVASDVKRLGYFDDEKVPTTPLERLDVAGSVITSRYRKAHEFETMQALVLGIRPELRGVVESMFCDSKACADYTLIVGHCSQADAETILADVSAACRAVDGGWNGITVKGHSGGSVYADPYWQDREDGAGGTDDVPATAADTSTIIDFKLPKADGA